MNKDRDSLSLLTVDEAATVLKVNPWIVREYIRKKQLKAQKIGDGTDKKGSRRSWHIWRQDLIDFINQGSNIKENI